MNIPSPELFHRKDELFTIKFPVMKTCFTVFLVLATLLVNAQPNKPLNLKLTEDLFYSRTPGRDKSVRMTVQNKLPSVLIIATDNSQSSRLNKEESFLHGKGKQAILVALPALYKSGSQDGVLTFYFGEKGAENDLDQAVVRISYQNAAAGKTKNMNRKPLMFPVSDAEVFTIPVSGNPVGEVNGKNFLLAEASGEKPVTVEIDREAQRGRVLVGIFSQKNGNLVAALDPKDPNNTASVVSFTVDEPVFIIPVIKPSAASNTNAGNLVFEVGDPREVATVTVSEE